MISEGERPVVARGLARDPKRRWANCVSFVTALNACSLDYSATSRRAEFLKGSRACSLLLFLATCSLLVLGLGRLIQSTRQIGLSMTPTDRRNASQREGKPRVAVLYFENLSQDQNSLAPLPKGLCAMMIAELHTQDSYDLVERERIEDVLSELRRTRTRAFDPTQVAEIGRLVGAHYLVFGSFFELSGTLRIDARLVDVETGITRCSGGVNGRSQDITHMIADLSNLLVIEPERTERAEPPIPAGSADRQPRSHTTADRSQVLSTSNRPVHDISLSLDEAIAYGRVLDAIDHKDKQLARRFLLGILTKHPGFLAAESLLKNLSND
jgi:TolB-like protein